MSSFNILREEKKGSGLSTFGGVCLSIMVKYIAFVVEKACYHCIVLNFINCPEVNLSKRV